MSIYLTRAQYSSSAFKGMVTSPSDRGAAARALFESIGIKTHTMHFSVTSGEIVTIIEGSDAVAAVTDALRNWVASERPGVQVECHRGGQPLYPYLFGVE